MRFLPPSRLCLRWWSLAGLLLALTLPGTVSLFSADNKTSLEARRLQASQARMKDIGYWEQAVAESPEDVTVRLALGNAYALNNRFKVAVREYERVVELYPDYGVAWNNLGSAYRAQGKAKKALRAYRMVLELEPHNALAYYNIGAVYDRSGKYDKALEYYGLAFRYDPKLKELSHNPQVATNRYIFAALLDNYLESEGAIAVPLLPAYPVAKQD